MKFIQIMLITLCLLANNQLTADTIEVESKITEATVFSYGAMVTRNLSLATHSGKQKLVIKGLPLSIDPKSIIVEASDNIEIISIKTTQDYIHKSGSQNSEIKRLIAMIPHLEDSLNYYRSLINVLNAEKKLISQHKNFKNEKGTTEVSELIKASKFYRQRLKEIELEMLTKNKMSSYWLHQIDSINSLKNKHVKDRSIKESKILVHVNILPSQNKKLLIKYFMPSASWYPYYDIKVDYLNDGLKLYRKAYVRQQTGEEWEDIKLTLSNANPKEKNKIPFLNPYIISAPKIYSPHLVNDNEVTGYVLDYDGNPLIGANIVIKHTIHGTVSDVEGAFNFSKAINRTVKVSYIGFKTKEVLIKSGINIIQLTEEGALLDEIVIQDGVRFDRSNVAASTASISGVSIASKKKVERKALKKTIINAVNSVEYKIEMPYSITSNNEEIDVLLDINTIDCSFEHHIVPLKSNKAYLTALIPDWHALDLLKGNANLFLSNTFKGSSTINPQSLSDTLSISIGVDPEIIVEREQKKDLSTKKFFGKKIEEELVYEISIKNNKAEAVNLKVMDQFPVSRNDEIDIKLLEYSGAILDEERGFLCWNIALGPGKSSTKRLSYKVKYPRDYLIEL